MIPRIILVLLLPLLCSHAFSPSTRRTARHLFAAEPDDAHRDEDFWTRQQSSFKHLNKGDLYAPEDLEAIFNLHNDLSEFRNNYQPPPTISDTVEPSIHDLVQQFVLQQQQESATTAPAISPTIQQKLKNIRAIASDVDGTLLTSNHALHPKTAQAMMDVIQLLIQDPSSPLEFFFLATGKTRPGALHHMTPELQTLLQKFPGVYSQGLYCIHNNQVVFEQTLSPESVHAAEQFALQHQLTLLGYYGDVIYATQFSHPHHLQDVHSKYGEPQPILLPTLQDREWHKLIFMSDDNETLRHVHRPLLNALADTYGATTTQAVPLMLELLPAGCHKGVGVRRLCEILGIDPETELLAMGDGENDKEMLDMAAIGIALGNAVAVTKEVADIVLTETNSEGGAGIALERYVLSSSSEEIE